MSTIHELDEFFELGGAAPHPFGSLQNDSFSESTPSLEQFQCHHEQADLTEHYSPSSHDIDMFMGTASGDDSYQSEIWSQNFVIDPQLGSMQSEHFSLPTNVDMLGTDNIGDFMRYPQQHERAQLQADPCGSCRDQQIDCVLLNNLNPYHQRICTSCMALSQDCSLDYNHLQNRMSGSLSPQPLLILPSNEVARTSSPEDDMASAAQSPRLSLKGSRSDGSTKSSTRFSRDVVRILRRWSSAHHKHPYPTEEEKEELQRRTGLSKIQITNWLANARRRGLVKPDRSVSPMPLTNSTQPIDIPGQAVSMEVMGPMERWENSPPEQEAASIAAIAHAVTKSPPSQFPPRTRSSYARSEHASIARASSSSSIDKSSASADSNCSHQSHGSFGSFGQRGRRRRRHNSKPTSYAKVNVIAARPYQCTFCVESFKTKHDWQRHEKSLHLSLEKWVCAPHGGIATGPNDKHYCSFCCHPSPNETHLELHNYGSCLDRSLEERTFYRKDHLRQHLRLVHNNCKFSPQYMDSWKTESPEVRSRCGFCAAYLSSWSERVDHLAEHFKAGMTMDSWNGDWGFEPHVQSMVENVSQSKLKKKKKKKIAERPSTEQDKLEETINRYEAVKQGIQEFIDEEQRFGRKPSEAEKRAIAFQIVLDNKLFSRSLRSWFSDLIMSRERQSLQPKLRGLDETKKDGNETSSNSCILERALRTYVRKQEQFRIPPSDTDLRHMACKILVHFDRSYSRTSGEEAAAWVFRLVMSGTSWISQFRSRCGASRKAGPPPASQIAFPEGPLDSGVGNYQKLESELAEYTSFELRCGIIPSDEQLRARARIIIFGTDAPWQQTAADSVNWLRRFKKTYGLSAEPGPILPLGGEPVWDSQVLPSSQRSSPLAFPTALEQDLLSFINRSLSQGIVPDDENIRMQARIICGTPTTPADVPYLLSQFKVMHGISLMNSEAPLLDFSNLDPHSTIPPLPTVNLEPFPMSSSSSYSDPMYRVSATDMLAPLANNLNFRRLNKHSQPRSSTPSMPLNGTVNSNRLGGLSKGLNEGYGAW